MTLLIVISHVCNADWRDGLSWHTVQAALNRRVVNIWLSGEAQPQANPRLEPRAVPLNSISDSEC